MKKRIIEFLAATAAILCLCVAMSDSPYFPWANFAALGLLAIIALAAEAWERPAAPRIDYRVSRMARWSHALGYVIASLLVFAFRIGRKKRITARPRRIHAHV